MLSPLLLLFSISTFCQQVTTPVETKATRHDESKALAHIPGELNEETTTQDEIIENILNEKRQATTDKHPEHAAAIPAGKRAVNIEQNYFGTRPAARLVASFDGLGASFEGPQGVAIVRNPSDNSLAVGPNHIMQTVNSRMAIFTKKGALYDTRPSVRYARRLRLASLCYRF